MCNIECGFHEPRAALTDIDLKKLEEGICATARHRARKPSEARERFRVCPALLVVAFGVDILPEGRHAEVRCLPKKPMTA